MQMAQNRKGCCYLYVGSKSWTRPEKITKLCTIKRPGPRKHNYVVNVEAREALLGIFRRTLSLFRPTFLTSSWLLQGPSTPFPRSIVLFGAGTGFNLDVISGPLSGAASPRFKDLTTLLREVRGGLTRGMRCERGESKNNVGYVDKLGAVWGKGA